MAKYQFDLSSFSIGDLVKLAEICQWQPEPARQVSWLRRLFCNSVEETMKRDSATTCASIIRLAAKFTDTCIDDIPVGDMPVFFQDFTDALEAFFEDGS